VTQADNSAWSIVGTFGQVEVELRQTRLSLSLSGPITYRDKVQGTFELGQTFLEDPPSRKDDRQTLPWWRSDYMGTAVFPISLSGGT
jgi:hypothetical protein